MPRALHCNWKEHGYTMYGSEIKFRIAIDLKQTACKSVISIKGSMGNVECTDDPSTRRKFCSVSAAISHENFHL